MGAKSFTDTPIVLSLTGDTSTVKGSVFLFNNGTVSLSIPDIGTATIDGSAFDNQAPNSRFPSGIAAGFGFNGGGTILGVYNQSFASWSLATPIGPLTGRYLFHPDQAYPTSLGDLNLTSVRLVTFTAWMAIASSIAETRVNPEYSPEARAAGLQGTVLLSLEAVANGTVQNVRIRRGLGMGLDERAVAAVQQWRYKALPVGVTVANDVVELPFRLDPIGRWLVVGSKFAVPSTKNVLRSKPILNGYTAPDEAACVQRSLLVPVDLQVEVTGRASHVRIGAAVDDTTARAVLRAARTWTFEPGTALGGAVASTGTVLLACSASGDSEDANGGAGMRTSQNAAESIVNISADVSTPEVVFRVNAAYPEKTNADGKVQLSFRVDRDGRATDIRVVHGLGTTPDWEAIVALKQWRFKPGMRNGEPVNTQMQADVLTAGAAARLNYLASLPQSKKVTKGWYIADGSSTHHDDPVSSQFYQHTSGLKTTPSRAWDLSGGIATVRFNNVVAPGTVFTLHLNVAGITLPGDGKKAFVMEVPPGVTDSMILDLHPYFSFMGITPQNVRHVTEFRIDSADLSGSAAVTNKLTGGQNGIIELGTLELPISSDATSSPLIVPR